MKTNMETRKGRILGIRIETREDCDADLYWLGRYSNQPGAEDRTIDRGEGRERGTMRYFVAEQSAKDTGNPNSVQQDYERMEAYNRGNWCMVGVIAKADVVLPGSNIVQKVTSGGLWGIVSDSGAEYLAEVRKEQLSELSGELTRLGFGKRAIAQVIVNVS